MYLNLKTNYCMKKIFAYLNPFASLIKKFSTKQEKNQPSRKVPSNNLNGSKVQRLLNINQSIKQIPYGV